MEIEIIKTNEIFNTMTQGIHHITAIASDARQCFHFYSTILGLRLVKKTVNQDDVATYHLFFGDRLGHPGMDITFFIFQPAMQGTQGTGQVTTISFAVPEKSLTFWQKRFTENDIRFDHMSIRFSKKRIVFWDPDGQQLELVGTTDNDNDSDIWTTKDITTKNAIRHFYSATLQVSQSKIMAHIIEQIFGYQHQDTEDQNRLYSVSGSERAHILEIAERPLQPSYNAAGTVHHIAFRAKDKQELLTLRSKVIALGLYPTEEIDRFYFKSVYFRTPDGILFEIATDGPGFTADQSESDLGQELALPPFLEPRRQEIERKLPKLVLE